VTFLGGEIPVEGATVESGEGGFSGSKRLRVVSTLGVVEVVDLGSQSAALHCFCSA
jgi:hypothetical protein